MQVLRRHEDLGLQPERTALAWVRTLASMMAIAVMFLKWIPDYGWLVLPPIIFASAVLLWVLFGSQRRYQQGVVGIAHDSIRAPLCEVIVLGGSVAVLVSFGFFLLYMIG